MKSAIVIAAILLAGCGAGQEPTVASDRDEIAVIERNSYQPSPIECEQVPGTANCPTPTDPHEGMELCDAWSYNPCQVPTWIPKRIEPAPFEACAQDSGCSDSPAPYIPRQ